jgi:sulfate adenylyltransferase subunit 1
VLTQTRRHSYLTHLVNIPHLVVAINKMDLVDYAQDVYERIVRDYLEFAAKLGIKDVRFIPMSALNGDMIVDRGERLDWYRGPTLIELLENAPTAHLEHAESFRFPVQYVCRPQDSANPALHDYRGFMGRIESGTVAVGDAVTVLPSGRETRVKDIQVMAESQPSAFAEQSVTLLLEDEIDISRGDMIVRSGELPTVTRQIDAMLCWLSEAPLDARRKYLIRHTTRETKAVLAGIEFRMDINSIERQPAEQLAMNDIAQVSFKLAQPIFADRYADNRGTGAFIVIDESTNNTVGAGMIV